MNDHFLAAQQRGAAVKLWLVICALAQVCVSNSNVLGLTIELEYLPAGSQEPVNDPGALKLTAILREAADRWEDILEDQHTMSVKYRYVTQTPLFTAVATNEAETPNGRRTLEGRIAFVDEPIGAAWFYDDQSPQSDEEHEFFQALVRDLSPLSLAEAYDVTSLQPQLESGYDGLANDAGAQGVDMLTVAMHELGHLLGVSSGGVSGLDGSQVEWEPDDDYDLPPTLLGGAVMAARRGDQAHLATESAVRNLMEREIIPNRRRLPSSTDIAAIAAVGDWTQVDLQRKNFLGGFDVLDGANWMGGRAPDQEPGEEDDVFFRRISNTGPGNYPNVTLSASTTVRDLHILEGSAVATGNHSLRALGNTVINPFGETLQTRLNVEGGGSLQTKNLDVLGGAFLIVGSGGTGGLVTVTDTMNIGVLPNESFVLAQGTIDVQNRLNNDGVLQTSGNLVLNTSNTDGQVWNLGGNSGDGRVSVVGGNLTVHGKVATFSGTMTVGSLRVVDFRDGWTLGPAGELNFSANTGSTTFRSTNTEAFGDINVDGEAFLDSAITLYGSSTINLPDFGDHLLLGNAVNDEIHLQGGSIVGQGGLTTSGPIFADSGTSTIAVRQFDWDGFSDSAQTTVAAGATLKIDVSSFSDAHDGTITVQSGGALDVVDSVGPQIAGTLNIAGGTVLADDLTLQSAATLEFSNGQLTADALFVRDGPTMNWTGGVLSANTVVGDLVNVAGTIAPGESGRSGVFGSYTQSDGGTLEIEIGGLVAVNEHDRFTVSKTATLGGELDILLIDGFSPALGDTFTIVSATESLLGEFDVENLPILSGLDWLIDYDLNNVVLEVIAGTSGDFDSDDDVDGADFFSWQRGELPNPRSATDLADWEANYGASSSAAIYATTVPEPSSWLLISLATVALIASTHNRLISIP